MSISRIAGGNPCPFTATDRTAIPIAFVIRIIRITSFPFRSRRTFGVLLLLDWKVDHWSGNPCDGQLKTGRSGRYATGNAKVNAIGVQEPWPSNLVDYFR